MYHLTVQGGSEQIWRNQILLFTFWHCLWAVGKKNLTKTCLPRKSVKHNLTVSSTSHKVSAQDALKFWFRATQFMKYSSGVALHQATSIHTEIANTDRVHSLWWILYYFWYSINFKLSKTWFQIIIQKILPILPQIIPFYPLWGVEEGENTEGSNIYYFSSCAISIFMWHVLKHLYKLSLKRLAGNRKKSALNGR